MKVHDKGVHIRSNLYFHTPSETSQRLYFYPMCCGHYHCDDHYKVQRNHYDSFLLLYVVSGEGYVFVDGQRSSLHAGSAFLLDCYQPHDYGTTSQWEILWVHFDGVMARPYFQAISAAANCRVILPFDPQGVHRCIAKIYTMFHEKGIAHEALSNKYILDALTDFLTASPAKQAVKKNSAISEELLAYIAENIQQPLRLQDLAKRASLSPFYFSRLFKEETGYTPYDYITTARVNAAKFYLKSTDLSIKEITFLCGFTAQSRFCTTFKNKVGATPASYRKSEGQL